MVIRMAAVAAAALALGAAQPARAQLYTTYNFSPTAVNWLTCGSIPGSGGCYGAGQISGFGHLCAVLEDAAKSKTGNYGSKQRLYLMDSNATGKNDVVMHVYEKTIVVSGNSATTSFTNTANLALPLVGGAACAAAANNAVVVAGTVQSTQAAVISKKTLAVSTYGGFSPPEDVTAITSDASGYISLNFSGGFYLLGPSGEDEEDGGGTAYVIPKDNSLILP